MFDLNKIVTDALNAAVAEAIKPLVERITALESDTFAMRDSITALESTVQDALVLRLAALENNPAIGTDTVLAERVKALEERPAVHIDEAKMVEALNSQEWFWEKLHNTINDNVSSRVEQALDDHCSTYDHDDYDNVVSNWNDEDPTEFVREGDLSSQINDALHGASFDVRIRL